MLVGRRAGQVRTRGSCVRLVRSSTRRNRYGKASFSSDIRLSGVIGRSFRRACRHLSEPSAAHYYDPSVAQFQDFDPFWEFVSGPLHAGTFGPNQLDNTFGPEVVFVKAPPAGQANLPPSAGLQFFGQVDIDTQTKTMTVALKDATGTEVYSVELQAK